MEKHSNLHAGHRDRMRERFASTQGKGMADHEILEMLLFYALPRRDTNDLAHCLIEEFGSLSAVLEADVASLCRVEGISEKSALYLTLIGQTARLYATEKIAPPQEDERLDSDEKIAAFMWPKFMGAKVEHVYLLLFDNSMRLLDCFEVCEGAVSGVAVSMRRVAERAYRKNAAAAVLAHNHPQGLAVPSGDDIHLTRKIDEAMALLGVPLLEHYIFTERSFAPIMSRCRVKPPEQQAASSLYEVFRQRTAECKAIDYDPDWWKQYE